MSELDALQAALAGEHAVLYAYGVGGARLSAAERDAAVDELERHRGWRDGLERLVRERGGEPVAALPGYALPGPVRTRAQARELLATVEARLADVYGDLVEQADGRRVRRLAATRLSGCAARAARWRGSTDAFPGLVDSP